MFIQGDLQAVFDALYAIGVIDPVLKMDWNKVSQEMGHNSEVLNFALATVNSCHGDFQQLIARLQSMDSKTLNFLALEVAREFAEYQDRSQLH